MAAGNLLIKPILEALKKAAVKKAAGTAGAKAAGLGVRELTKLSNLDILNLVRAKAVKGAKTEVAKSLGISVKELNATIASIRMTEARKTAVKGANYIRNANRFLKDPVKTITGQGKRIISQERRNLINDLLDQTGDERTESERELDEKRELLKVLQDKLYDKASGQGGDKEKFTLSQEVWDNLGSIDKDHIIEIDQTLEEDMYYNYEGDDTVVWSTSSGGPGGGYKLGLEVEEYMAYVETLLLSGSSFTPFKDGKL